MKRRFMMKSYISPCLKGGALLAACILIGLLLVLGAYAIPADAVRGNLRSSVDMLIEEGMYPLSIPGYTPSKLDNFTDAIMLGNAIVAPEETLLSDALLAHRLDSNYPAEALRDYLAGETDAKTVSYSNYWHGYIVMLKPLLCVLSYSSIRILLMAVQIALVVLTAVLLEKRKLGRYAIALAAMYISLCPVAVMSSLTYSSMYLVGMGASALMLAGHERLKRIGYGYVFLVLGAITSYVDFLTYPVFTLGVPLTIYVLLEREEEKNILVRAFMLCVLWGIGYGVMWASKWVLVALLTDVNGLKEALAQILLRTDQRLDNVGEVAFWAGLESGLEMILNPLNALMLAGCAAACVCLVFRRGVAKEKTVPVMTLLLTAMLPVAWMVFACNHTVSHSFYAYRNLAVLIFAGLCALLMLGKEKKA